MEEDKEQSAVQEIVKVDDSKKKNNKVTVIIAGVSILLIGIAIAGLSIKKDDQPVPTNNQQSITTPEVAVVSIASTGFNPATIKIKAGSQIQWKNTDTAQHWIASDPHPTHTLLPELNSNEGMSTNDVFAFTFENPGTFTYHDHLNPNLQAVVIVE